MEYNRHHLLPKSRWGTSHPDNVDKMKVYKHSALHCLFDNKTPIEQIIQILTMNEKVFTKKFQEDLVDVLVWHVKDYYNHHITNNKYEYKKEVWDLYKNFK